MRFIVDGLRARGPFDGVESHVLYTAGFAALVVARLRGLPLLAYAHGTDARQYAHWGRGYRFFVRQVVRHADLLIVLDQGRLVETGTHAELIARNGLYARLIRRQLGAAQEPVGAVAN